MNFYIYSDGSKKWDKGIAVTLILSDYSYITEIPTKLKDASSSKAELVGMCQGLQYIQANMPDAWVDSNNTFIIKVDHEALVTTYNKIKNTGKVENTSCPHLWSVVLELVKGKNIKMQHIKGHQEIHNPNKTCDILAGILI